MKRLLVTIKSTLRVLYTAAVQLLSGDAMAWAAGLAFYATLGLAPLILVLLSLAALLGRTSQEAMHGRLSELLGTGAADAVRLVIENADRHRAAGWTSVAVGIVTFIVSASAVFAHVQASLNAIWNVEPPADAGRWRWVWKRLLTIAMAPLVVVLLLASVIATTSIPMFLPQGSVWLQIASVGVSLLLYAMVFGLSFKLLPDVRIGWRDVLIGSVVTAVLFELGKYGIGLYLGYLAMASAYGAAGSLVVLLLWVYYSSIIFFYGAELTEVWTRKYGSGFRPRRLSLKRKRRQPPADAAEETRR